MLLLFFLPYQLGTFKEAPLSLAYQHGSNSPIMDIICSFQKQTTVNPDLVSRVI